MWVDRRFAPVRKRVLLPRLNTYSHTREGASALTTSGFRVSRYHLTSDVAAHRCVFIYTFNVRTCARRCGTLKHCFNEHHSLTHTHKPAADTHFRQINTPALLDAKTNPSITPSSQQTMWAILFRKNPNAVSRKVYFNFVRDAFNC